MHGCRLDEFVVFAASGTAKALRLLDEDTSALLFASDAPDSSKVAGLALEPSTEPAMYDLVGNASWVDSTIGDVTDPSVVAGGAASLSTIEDTGDFEVNYSDAFIESLDILVSVCGRKQALLHDIRASVELGK